MCPALTTFGRRVTPEGDCVDAVHLLSWTIIAGLHRSADPPPSSRRRVVLACTDGSDTVWAGKHYTPCSPDWASPRGCSGASVPVTALAAAAAQRFRPATVVVGSQGSRTGHTSDLRRLEPTAGQVIAAGRDGACRDCPPGCSAWAA